MTDTPKQKKSSPQFQAFFFAAVSHGDEWGFFVWEDRHQMLTCR